MNGITNKPLTVEIVCQLWVWQPVNQGEGGWARKIVGERIRCVGMVEWRLWW